MPQDEAHFSQRRLTNHLKHTLLHSQQLQWTKVLGQEHPTTRHKVDFKHHLPASLGLTCCSDWPSICVSPASASYWCLARRRKTLTVLMIKFRATHSPRSSISTPQTFLLLKISEWIKWFIISHIFFHLGWGNSSVVNHFPRLHEVLNSTSSTQIKSSRLHWPLFLYLCLLIL